MKTITDDDLILLYYGEHDDPGLARRVAGDAELSRRFDALGETLGVLESATPPTRGDAYGARVWQRLVPSLAQSGREVTRGRWAGLLQPWFSAASAAAVVAVAALAFIAGQTTREPMPVPGPGVAMTAPTIDSGRLLQTQVSSHLGSVDVMLTQFANMPETGQGQAEQLAEWATEMLVSNRLYRRAAEAAGNRPLAAMLGELEPLLIELAHHSYENSPSTRERLQQEVQDDLLFKVRVVNNDLSNTPI